MIEADLTFTRLDTNCTPKKLWVAWAGKKYDEFPEDIKIGTLVFVKVGKFRDDIIYEVK